MFDTLTFDELYNLHASLFHQATAVHRRMVSPAGYPLIPTFSDEWAILSAWHDDICEMQFAVGEELHRRAEEAHADA